MTPREFRNICNIKIAVRTHFHVRHEIKTTLIFLLADGEASWSLLLSLVLLLPGGTVPSENAYSCTLKLEGQVWESQKRISMNTSHSYHQRLSHEVSLNWSNGKIWFSFRQLDRKRWSARLVNVIKHLPHNVFLLWH